MQGWRWIVAAAGLAVMAPGALAQQSQQQKSQQQKQMVLDREALALVGYDLNEDGQSDVYYWVSQWDLEPLRADQRRAQMGGGGQEPQFRQMTERRMGGGMGQAMKSPGQSSMQSEVRRFSGTIEDVASFQFDQGQGRHIVAKVDLQNGQTVPVLLGKESQLPTRLSEGKRISFLGDRGSINGRPVIVARSLSDGQRSYQISQSQPTRPGTKVIEGTITGFKTFTPEGKNQRHLLARVQTDRGQTQIVHLGPVNQLQNTSINRGTDLKAIVAPGSINGQPVLMARSVSAEGEMFSVGSGASARNRTMGTSEPLNLRSFRGGGQGN